MSNLSSLSKLLEHAVCNQMESHLVDAGLFPRHQSAYRKGHSTETALVCADLIQQINSGHHVLLAMLDLSAAFDNVDHCILTERSSRSFAICDGVLDSVLTRLPGWPTLHRPVWRYRVFTKRHAVRCTTGLGPWPTPLCLIYRRSRQYISSIWGAVTILRRRFAALHLGNTTSCCQMLLHSSSAAWKLWLSGWLPTGSN